MEISDHNGTRKNPKAQDKGNIRIRNMLASIERTFLPVGSQIGKYKIIEEIDRGGMAVVYKALQLDLDREVALKVMPANITINRRFVERFLTEAHAVAKLNHPNIVAIHEVAVENNIYYLAMDYIPGKNLYYHLHFHKPKLVDVLEIVSRLTDALEYAHSQKIIHRDLKLNNVIMRDKLTPVLIDFGLAKALENEDDKGGITRTGEIMGSPSYMAPERILGGIVDHRSDICSLGIMLYEMLTFKNPYLDQRNLHQTTMNVMEACPIPPRKLVPWLPAEIEAITLKAMSKSVSDRYQTMYDFRSDINRYQRGEPVLARPPSIWAKVRHYARRHWAQLVIFAIILLFSSLFGISMYLQSQKEQSHWQHVRTEKFGTKAAEAEWRFTPDSLPDDTAWQVENGTLLGRSDTLAFAQLRQHFNRDILIECDIEADSLDLFNAGIYLFGNHPDSAYCFHFNRLGRERHGISLPGSDFLIQDIDPSRVEIRKINNVVIERLEHSIRYSINGVPVARLWDFLPPLGKNHQNIGFFINGCPVRFDNLKIYFRATPQAPSPTLIADRILERGDFEAALDEYRGLLVDFADEEISNEIKIKMADCLIRLQRPDEALSIINRYNGQKNKNDALTARNYFLKGIIFGLQDKAQSADSILHRLAIRFPTSPVNSAAMTFALIRNHRFLRLGRPSTALHEISMLSDYYHLFPEKWGRLHLSLLYHYLNNFSLDTALSVSEEMMSRFKKEEYFVAAAQTAQGYIYLHKGKIEKANDLFDRCITAHLNTDGVWDAWMALADIYKYDFRYGDALTIYQKIFRESTPSIAVHWMAAVEAADLIGRKNGLGRDSLLNVVVSGPHPFPVPRMIARLYLGEMPENRFKEKWERFFPDDRSYLICLARKAMIHKEQIVAGLYLNDLKRKLPRRHWNYFRTVKILNNLENW